MTGLDEMGSDGVVVSFFVQEARRLLCDLRLFSINAPGVIALLEQIERGEHDGLGEGIARLFDDRSWLDEESLGAFSASASLFVKFLSSAEKERILEVLQAGFFDASDAQRFLIMKAFLGILRSLAPGAQKENFCMSLVMLLQNDHFEDVREELLVIIREFKPTFTFTIEGEPS